MRRKPLADRLIDGAERITYPALAALVVYLLAKIALEVLL